MEEKYFGIIYRAIFKNGKCYIGQTTRGLNARIREHVFNKAKENVVFHNAINKYGEENITWEVIDFANSIEELNEKEKYWISFYNSYVHSENSNGYNMTLGGNSTIGWKPSEETKSKISKANKGKMAGDKNHQYGKKGYLATWFGRNHTKEEKEKISIANEGKIVTKETRDKISKANIGKRKGIPNTPEQKLKISMSKKGHTVSAETRKKISESKRKK